ncbi:PKD domain-containing protein [Geodermatophilus sp. URMC 60]
MSSLLAAWGKSLLSGLLSLLVGVGVVMPAPAEADSAPLDPANPATPATVTADALPTVQINGVAWSQVVVGNTVYVAGSFSTARPAGAAPGTREVARNNLLAYDIRTGALVDSFAPSLNAQALAVTASPDGSRIYVGGDFTAADGQARSNIAAYDTATGQLVSDFKPAFNSQVTALAATNDRVFAGGWFTAVGANVRRNLAAVAANGTLLPWAPVPGPGTTTEPATSVMALVVTGNGTQVVAGGRFGTLNGTAAVGVGALDATTGATRPFAVNQVVTNQGRNSAIYSLSTDGASVYGTAYNFGGPGNLEGSFKATANGGQVQWINDCRGDTYSSFPANGVLYHATHAHDCAPIGGFPEQNPRVNQFGTAVSLAATGTVGNRVASLAGKPAPSLLPWYPTFYSGTYTGQFQAGWSVTGNSQYVVYGGEFPGVNGSEQQGLVRFAVPALAPNEIGPRTSTTWTPSTAMVTGGVRVSWPAVADRDNEHLAYRVYRDSDTAAPVCEVVRPSTWWQLPTYSCTDTGASAGTHRYLVVASDPAGNRLSSGWVTATVGAANSSPSGPYSALVSADGAGAYWSLGETSGSLAHDRVGTMDVTVNSGVTRNQAGAIAGDGGKAFAFNGTSTGYLATRTAIPGPQTFTLEAWFRTTSTAGGKMVGFGNASSGNSTKADRQIHINTQGQVLFGVYPGSGRTVGTARAYNDGAWHHVVASLSSSGMALYLDGQLAASRADTTSAQVYNGYWRIGGDTPWSGTGSGYLNGRVDEVAVYPVALTAAQVRGHYDLGTGVNAAPTAAFTSSAAGLVVSVDGSGSADADGRVASHAWDFGDGGTGTGATATHTYAAAGTYQVKLTVTDDKGATGTVTRAVTVTAPQPPAEEPPAQGAPFAVDSFGRAVASGWGTAEVGGAWTIGGSTASPQVVDGAGQLSGAAGRSTRATLARVSAQDVAVQAEVVLPQAPTGSGTYVSLAGRRVGTSDYRATLRFQASGLVDLRLDRIVEGVETVLGTVRLPGTYTAGTALTVRLELTGSGTTTLAAKAWAQGAAEPADWALTRTDGTAALQVPGGLYLETYTAANATRTQVFRIDDLWAGAPGTVQTPEAPEPPANVAPTAGFTSSAAGLVVSVDGSGSADADGRVASHAWDFGDGGTGTGATATHTYAAAGTYQVKLMVTDDKGATGTVTRAVTVTAPQPPAEEPPAQGAPFAADSFGRAVTSGWGTAEVGGAWTIGGSTASPQVADGAGQISSGAGRESRASLAGVSQQEVAVQADITLPQAATGGGSYISLAGRRIGTSDYRATLRFQASGLVDLRLDRMVDGTETVLRTVRLPGTYTAGTALSVRLELTGNGTTTLKGKAWTAGTAEPADWTVTTTDSTAALQAPGGLYLETYTAANATRTQVFRIDDLRAGPAGTAPQVD